MIFTKSQTHKLIITTLAVCCLTTSVYGGKLPTIRAIINGTKVAASTKADISKTEATTVLIETEIKSSEEEEEVDEKEEDNDTADNENESSEKNALQPAADTSLSVWSIVDRLWNWIREDISESLFGDDGKTSAVGGEGRTFGKIRRLQMALIPIVFKFGVLSAMVAFLVAVGVKTLFLVKVLIVMNLLALLAKFFTLKQNFGHVEHFSSPPAPVWSPYVNSGWHSAPEAHHSNKEIHLHIHGGQLQQPQGHSYGNVITSKPQGWERRNDPYSAYETIALQGQQSESLPNELTTSVNSIASSGGFPGNHRMF